MKTFYITFTFLFAGILFSQETNVQSLEKLSAEFQKLNDENQEFARNYFLENPLAKEKYKNQLVGKIGKFLVFVEDTDADQILAANVDLLYNNSIPDVNVTGEGMTIYQWDGGRVDDQHQEYTGRVTNMEDESVNVSLHSTAIAGILIAQGVNPQAKGMAYEANLNAYNFVNNFNEISTESANNPNFMISNHSYGYQAGWRYGSYDDTIGEMWYWFGYPGLDENQSVLYGIYSDVDSFFDIIAAEAPNHLMIKSAGNDRGNGPGEIEEHAALNENDEWQIYEGTRPNNCAQTGFDCLPYGSVAKNILMVGSINQIQGDGRYMSPENISSSSFSSFGPTDDGRIKPDIVAQGSSVFVPIPDNEYFGGVNGTSASSPSVAGIALLLQQLYNELNEAYLNASELKALLLNTTNETGANPGPDYQYGFGLVDAAQGANLVVNQQNNEAIILSGTKSNETVSYDLVAHGNEPIRATIVWIDPAIDPREREFVLNNRTPTLVNDLDMRIVDNATSTTYFPWTLDVENPANAAVPGDNILDNVEQVFIAEGTENGAYTLTVNHKNELQGENQDYAIVVSGARLATQSTANIANQDRIKIYPNPVQDKLNISGLESAADIRIVNTEGRIVYKGESSHSVNVNHLPKGTYLIIIKEDNNVFSEKFIKK